jgi:hypothetical protein
MECGTPFKGRPDKKFCSDQCRTTFNNRLNSAEVNYIRNINNTLRKNRRILRGLNPHGKNKVTHDDLRLRGFNFMHFTSIYRTRDGGEYFYCYEQGYKLLSKDRYLLVVKKKSMD